MGVRIPVGEAGAQLEELIRRAQAGEEVILTRNGHDVVRLEIVRAAPAQSDRRALLEAARESGAAKATDGPSAARSQDFLYGEEGVPE